MRVNGGRGDMYHKWVKYNWEYCQRLETKIREFMELLETNQEPRAFDPVADDVKEFF